MSWNAVTTDDVLSEFTGQEQSDLETLQADTDSLQAILTRTINAARGNVKAGGGTVDQDGTIADSLAPHIIAIARWRWLVSIPKSDALQSDARKALHDDAVKYLKEVAKGEIKVEVPDKPQVSANPNHAVETVRPGRRIRTGSFDKLGET